MKWLIVFLLLSLSCAGQLSTFKFDNSHEEFKINFRSPYEFKINLMSPREELKINLRLPQEPKRRIPASEFRIYRSNMVNIRTGRMKFTVKSSANRAMLGQVAMEVLDGDDVGDFIQSQQLSGIVKFSVRARYRLGKKLKIYSGVQSMSSGQLMYVGFVRKF